MATPPEEIAKQHEAARQLVLAKMLYADPPSHDEIPLSMKTCPTIKLFASNSNTKNNGEEEKKEETKSIEHNDNNNNSQGQQLQEDLNNTIVSWSSRGHVDVTKLQELVREGYRIAEHTPPASPAATATRARADSSASSSTAASSSTSTSNTAKSTTTKSSTTTSNNKKKVVKKAKQYTAADVKSVTNLWDPINATVNNVAIVRPSHDAWGIGKIVLLFADDFLQDVYELPWWHLRDDMRHAIQPMLDVLQVPIHRVVRLLLASLPPHTTIPLHHDSGAWVTQTHRCHCPVIVERVDEIVFRVGLTDDSLQRIDCTPGHVFEINNQGRHAVSNCSDDYRVHLILDYMDDDDDPAQRRRRIPLDPGERLLQTRRSVDRLKDQGSRPTPSFLILGAQKAGTTSLYEYMMQHPLIVRPKRRETHCLDWRWKEALEPHINNNKSVVLTTDQLRAHCHLFFESAALQFHPSCCTGDSTPSYLLDSRRVIPNLKRVFDWPISFLVSTRNPIARAESHYAMVTSPHGTPQQLQTRGTEWRSKSFAEVVQQELQDLKDCGVIPYWDIEKGVCDTQGFEEFSNTPQEDEAWNRYLERHVPLNTGSYGLLARGLYALNLRPWLQAFDAKRFLVLQLERDLADPQRVRTTMERVFDHVGVPSSFELTDVTPQNTRDYDSKMDAELHDYLQRFFEPHNQRWDKLVSSLGISLQ